MKKNKFAELQQYIEKHQNKIENTLRENLPVSPPQIEDQFNKALEYSLLTNELRIYSILTLLGAELVGGNPDEVLPSAAAVEYINLSSQIFDGLLNSDQTVKEKRLIAEKFGKELAVLVGLGFLNSAYPLVFVNHRASPEQSLSAHAEIVECVGAAGLIGGIYLTENETQTVESETLKYLRNSALMRLALRVGAILSGANYIELANISRFAELFSEVYHLNNNTEIIQETKTIEIKTANEEAKLILLENFPSNTARTCLIQLSEYLSANKF